MAASCCWRRARRRRRVRRARAARAARAARPAPFVARRLRRRRSGPARQPALRRRAGRPSRPISNGSRTTARSPPRAAARCSCRTSPICPRPCRRASRASRATAKCASTASRWRPTSVDQLVASAAPGHRRRRARASRFRSDLLPPARRRRASICRRCASGRRRPGARDAPARGLVRRWRARARARSRRPRSRCSPALTWPGNLGRAAGRSSSAPPADAARRRDSDRRRAAGAQSRHSALANVGRSCRRATCARRGCASSATTSRRCCSIMAGAWPSRPDARHPASESVSESAPAGHSADAGVRVACMNHDERKSCHELY